MRRPTVERKRAFLAALAEIGMVGRACRLAGCDRASVHRWRLNDAEFAAAFERAKAEAADPLRELRAIDPLMAMLIESRPPEGN
jgi:hypothetical protein